MDRPGGHDADLHRNVLRAGILRDQARTANRHGALPRSTSEFAKTLQRKGGVEARVMRVFNHRRQRSTALPAASVDEPARTFAGEDMERVTVWQDLTETLAFERLPRQLSM